MGTVGPVKSPLIGLRDYILSICPPWLNQGTQPGSLNGGMGDGRLMYAFGLLADASLEKLDQEGVGQLIVMAVQKGRSVKPDLKTGICGEHGGEPTSVKFCHRAGLNYVSCSPYRVPLARLAAAQAVLEEKATKVGD